MHEHVIWEGRFQPIHRGHVRYVERLLESAENLWIFVVANETSAGAGRRLDELPVPEFTRVVDGHHVQDKNPLPFWVRYELVVGTLRAEFPEAPITVWGGRRLDLDWPMYANLLPRPRVFMTPLRDEFEDHKAAAWQKLGETVERIDVSDLPKVSGTELRAALCAGNDPSEFLCPSTVESLRQTGYLTLLKDLPEPNAR